MKGKISGDLEAILRDDEGRKQLRRSLISGKDCRITVGGKNYRVSTRNTVYRSACAGRFVTKKEVGSLKTKRG